MTDKNGSKIITGMTVRIANAYCKSDNGLYFVHRSPGDPTWCGRDYSLVKICKSGKPSKGKYSTAFWPLTHFMSDRRKAAEAKAWDKANATIEVVNGIDMQYIIEALQEEHDTLAKQTERQAWDWGEDNAHVQQSRKSVAWYEELIERIKREAAPAKPRKQKAPDNTLHFFWNGIKVGDGDLIRCFYRITRKKQSHEVEEVWIYAKEYGHQIPWELNPTNDTDSMTDYFCTDVAVVKPGDKYFEAVLKAVQMQEVHNAKRVIRKGLDGSMYRVLMMRDAIAIVTSNGNILHADSIDLDSKAFAAYKRTLGIILKAGGSVKAALAIADMAAGLTSRETFATYGLFTGAIGEDERVILEEAAPILAEAGNAVSTAEIMGLIDKYGEKKAVSMRL